MPADLILLRTSDRSGSVFVRTDQLDGETDWKLRLAVPTTQKLAHEKDLFGVSATIYAEKPQKDIHSFIGTFTRVINCFGSSVEFLLISTFLQHDTTNADESLDLKNTVWSNCIIASGQALGVVIYTGLY